MSTARGHVIAGQVWHITQRCYQKRYLLELEADRRRWLYWLYQSRKLYKLSVLNYTVTSNHVHMLVQGHGNQSLRVCMNLINSRTTAEFNRYHRRRDPLWESGYQVTAVQSNAHLARCITYMDLNMVRAGVVSHPRQWRCSGYYELLSPPRRSACIDRAALRGLLNCDSDKALREARDCWINNKLKQPDSCPEPYWSNSIAVGDLAFALKMKRALAYTHPGGRAQRESGCFAVREPWAGWSVC